MSRNVGGSLAFDTAARTVGAMTTNYGPQTEQVIAHILRCRTLTVMEIVELEQGWRIVRGNPYDSPLDRSLRLANATARRGRRLTAWNLAWKHTRNSLEYSAVRGVAIPACALVVRDLMSANDYELLTGPWRTVIGPLHPDDPEAQLPSAALLAWQGIARANPDWTLAEVTEATQMVMARP